MTQYAEWQFQFKLFLASEFTFEHSPFVSADSLSTPTPCQIILSLDPIKASSKQVYKAALQAFAHYSETAKASNIQERLHELRFE